ncbi:MAG: GNAT family N-acetyltransferase [Clostridia bacterium]|nr:GNAT family N-acetyltransferase [Clostridia bacterium]
MILFPQDSMKSDLMRLWRACFGDSDETVRYFFDHRYAPDHCLCYVDEAIRRPVAMLHLLPAGVSEDGGLAPAQYLYAACTREDYRRQGIMASLIETARRLGRSRGVKYTLTVPAEPHLFRYYSKQGFYRGYQVRMVYMDRADLRYLCRNRIVVPGTPRDTMMKLSEVCEFRRHMLVDREGYVNWDLPAFRYAVGSHEQEGGHVVTLTYQGDSGYAFCHPEGDTVRVSEFIVRDYFASALLKRILQSYPKAQRFIFRLPVCDSFFEKYGEVLDFAMISRNDGKNPVSVITLEGSRAPYLGLPLD